MSYEKEKRIEEINRKILVSARNELYLHLRFLDVALSTLRYQMDAGTDTIGTDGIGLYYHPAYLGGLYREGRREVNRAYLHVILHCIFGHLWKKTEHRKKRACQYLDREIVDILWNTACDIAVESVIDGLPFHCVKRPMSREKKNLYAWLKRRRNVLHAEGIFQELTEQKPDLETAKRWEKEFHTDNHGLWERRDNNRPPNERPKENWEDIRDKMETEMETFGQDLSEGSPGFLEQIKVENRETFDYRNFLKKFAVVKEEAHLDPDAFDYVFYSYGLSVYGNMPLIEPQETREVKKIEEFVIAIDTSMSCSGEAVKRFLQETYGILKEEESFFRKINIHILQCDERIQKDEKITSKEELENYMETLELAGQGGTDFRPVFAYIQKLQENKELTGLKGLLYFTDGQGIFPNKMPSYDTAFILMQKDYQEVEVPPWAMKIYIQEEGAEYEY